MNNNPQKHRIGERTLINGLDAFAAYSADLKKFTVLPHSVTARYKDFPKTSALIYYGSELSAKGLELQFYVSGKTDDDAQINVSKLLKDSLNCTIQKHSSDFLYRCILLDYSLEDTQVEYYLLVTLTFACVEQKNLVHQEFTQTSSYYNYGNTQSGCVYKITPTFALASFTIDEITVKNLVANETFIIDGINKKVTSGGVNRFGDTVGMTDFPTTMPGLNKIILSVPTPFSVEYYPTYF